MKLIAPTLADRISANIKFRIALARAPKNIVLVPVKK